MDPVINLETEEKEIDRRIEIIVETSENMAFTSQFERESLVSVLEKSFSRIDKEIPSLDVNKAFNEAMRGGTLSE
jgi:hypothetical protein